jgi:sugar phosphate permease
MSDSLPLNPIVVGHRKGTAATVVRHLVVAAAVLASVLLYLDRFCVSFAERYIREDLGLSERQMAWFLSAFFWSYAFAQVPSGWLSDRRGARAIFAFYIIIWSAFTGLIGLATGFAFLLIMRLGCGVGQAGAYPTCAALLARWVPITKRGTASSLVGLGGRLGGALAPILTGYSILAFVPLGTPVQFDPQSVLNANRLRDRLTDSGAAAAVAHIQKIIPTADRDRLRTDESPEVLVTTLNSLLSRSDLYDEAAFRKLSFPREAVKFLARREAGQALSAEETARFNRLLLEAVFPGEVGKLYTRGWRPVLIIYGCAGIVVAVFFWIIFRNHPREHPWSNLAERELIECGRTAEEAQANPVRQAFPFVQILSSRTLWLDSLAQCGTNVGWLFLVTALPRYLAEVHQVPILQRAWMVSIPSFAGIAGLFLGGRLTDWLVLAIGLRWGRGLPMVITKLCAALAYGLCLVVDGPWAITWAFAAAYFFTDLGIAPVWAVKQDIGGQYVGSILGWGNMWGNLGAAMAPLLYDGLLGEHPTVSDWRLVFLMCAASYVIAGLASLGIDATVKIRGRVGDVSL